MKRLLTVVLVGAFFFSFGAVFLFGWKPDLKFLGPWLSSGTTQTNQGPPKVVVERLNELVSLKVKIRRILSGQNDWYKGVWEVEGDALFSTDCSRAEWLGIDPERKSITLRLPEPKVIMCRVDLERTKLYDFRSHSWNPFQLIWGNPEEMREEAMRQAQLALEKDAGLEEYISHAKQQAEWNLKYIYSGLGWNLTVEWQSKRTSITE